MESLTNLSCPRCGEKLWKYDHDESILFECDKLECNYQQEIDLEQVIEMFFKG